MRNNIGSLAFAGLAAIVMAGCQDGGSPVTQSTPPPSTEAKSDFDSKLASSQLKEDTGTVPGQQAKAPGETTAPSERMPKKGDEVVVLETDKGKIVVMFFPDKAPNHVKNFKDLTKKGFYNGTKFHRIIPGFMIQGGDPNTKSGDRSTWGQGGPSTRVNAEFNDVHHAPGTLSMARSQDPNSAGSQFFICVADAGQLDGQYTAFGKTVYGLDIAEQIVSMPAENDIAVNPVTIKKATVQKWPLK